MRYVVQRNRGRHWETWTGDDVEATALVLLEQEAVRGRRGDRFRLVDADTLTVIRSVENG